MCRIRISLALLFLFLIISSLFSCKGEPGTPPIQHPFTYEITGTAARVDLRYQDPRRGGYTQLFNVALPWNKDLTYLEPSEVGNSYYLAARNITSAGSVIVSVYVDSVLEKTETTADPFGFVAVYGTTP